MLRFESLSCHAADGKMAPVGNALVSEPYNPNSILGIRTVGSVLWLPHVPYRGPGDLGTGLSPLRRHLFRGTGETRSYGDRK